MTIRMKNLPLLLKDMEVKQWVIDSFPFNYNGHDYIIILKVLDNTRDRYNQYCKAELEFIRRNDVNQSIFADLDFYEAHFDSVVAFCDFFGIQARRDGRDVFRDFADILANFIPAEKIENRNDPVMRRLQGSRAEGNNPNAIYCYDVRRNGQINGVNNKRSIENSNKAKTLRPVLFNHYSADPNLSFFFSENPNHERTDAQIIQLVASRK